jgi:DNA polymerase III delta subunit
MLYVYYGTDQVAVRQKAHSTLDGLLAPEETFVRLEGESYEPGLMAAYGSGASLFSPRLVYLLEAPLAHPQWKEEVFENLDVLKESAHVFVMIESALLAPEKKKLAGSVVAMEEFSAAAGASFNPFKMAEALAVKDKKNLWLLIQEAKQHNLSAEEIIGTLWWQLKAIRLAASTKTAEEAGMKDFPYKKAKAALRTFALEDVVASSRSLLKVYHAGHKGKVDIDLALEQWVLSL